MIDPIKQAGTINMPACSKMGDGQNCLIRGEAIYAVIEEIVQFDRFSVYPNKKK